MSSYFNNSAENTCPPNLKDGKRKYLIVVISGCFAVDSMCLIEFAMPNEH